MLSKMNYIVLVLGLLTCGQFWGIVFFSCNALKLDEGDPCKDPAEACKVLGNGTFVYNPEDCHQYYYCITNKAGDVVPSDNPVDCTVGLTFDYESQNCSGKISSCDKACINRNCLFECTSTSSGYSVDPNNCNVYYFCYMGTTSASYCPESTPYFDGAVCTDKEYLCCDACTVYCSSGDSGKNIADPYDCTAYYTCDGSEGIPNENLHSYCNEGEYFESDIGSCTVDTGTCKPICHSF